MDKSFLFVFPYNLLICFMVSSSYFQFDEITVDFVKSLRDPVRSNAYDQPLRYVNWILPLVTPILICFIRPFRFNLHQALIYHLICLFFLNIVFYALEFVVLVEIAIHSNVVLFIWCSQIVHSFILSIIYWINFVSLISHFNQKDALLIVSRFYTAFDQQMIYYWSY